MKKKANRIQFVLVGLVITVIIALFLLSGFKKDIGPCREYHMDVKVLSLTTNIDVYQEEKLLYTVSGNLFRIIEDPLTMYTDYGEEVAHAGDAYHFIAQDSHGIIYGARKIDMVGEVQLLGESYSIYDNEGKKIARVYVDPLNTHGTMTDTDGTLLADYTSRFPFYDFDVRVKDDCPFEDEVAIMIFSAYFSDFKYDSKSN